MSALQEQWWEALEVSSNSQHKENLVDDSQTTSWESTGRSGTHWIRFHMKQGLIIKCVVCVWTVSSVCVCVCGQYRVCVCALE